MKKIFLLFTIFLCSLTSQAQDRKIRTKFETGDIASTKEQMAFPDDYTQTTEPYQSTMIGVATGNEHPIKKSDLIIKEGEAMVKVTDENGIVHKGDLITSSSIKGAGMKATKSGMVVGIALEDGKAGSGLIKMRVLIQYVKQ